MEEDEEDEPRLKYQRFGASSSVPDILSGDSASTMCVSSKVLALGTHNGHVHILDLNGNQVKKFEAHAAMVNELCFDHRGEFVASCSDDGSVVITSLYTDEQSMFNYPRPIKSVALDPDYAVKKSCQFVTGGLAGQLVLNSKGWLGARDHVLHSGEGAVHAVRWRGSLIAWANDVGVKMYDSVAQQRITYIDRPRGSPRPELFRAHLHWADDHTLIIAWADCVKVARVSSRTPALSQPTGGGGARRGGPGGAAALPKANPFSSATTQPGTSHQESAQAAVVRYVEIVAMFQTDYYISGAAPWGDSLVLLAYLTPQSGASGGSSPQASTSSSQHEDTLASKPNQRSSSDRVPPPALRPEVRLVTWRNEEISADVLAIHGHEHFRCNDYLLAFHHPGHIPVGPGSPLSALRPGSYPNLEGREEPLVYLVSPKDVVVGRRRDPRDRVQWLLERSRYAEALEAAEQAQGAQPDLFDQVGRAYLEHLLEQKEYDRAASLCPRLLKDQAGWERAVFQFAEVQRLPALVPHLPIGDHTLRMKDKVYELVLQSFLPHKEQHGALLRLVQEWPRELFNPQTLISAVARRLAAGNQVVGGGGVAGSGGNSTSGVPALRGQLVELQEVLAVLHMHLDHREQALTIYLNLGRPGLFEFIHQHKLYSAVGDKVAVLLRLDPSRAISLLVEQRTLIPPSLVVPQLLPPPPPPQRAASSAKPHAATASHSVSGQQEQQQKGDEDELRSEERRSLELHMYLCALFERDPAAGAEFHALQVELYARHDPAHLLAFLQSSQSYPLEGALEVCKRAGLVKEQVYVLGRMGNTKEALALIIKDNQDIHQAIDFVQAQQDEELWEQLITHSLESAPLVGALLERIGQHTDPLVLLRRIPLGLEIPCLRERLVRILADYRTQTSLRLGCNAILRADCAALAGRLHIEARRSVRLEDPVDAQLCKKTTKMTNIARCCLCIDPLTSQNTSVIVFFCAHAYHFRCLKASSNDSEQLEEAINRTTSVLGGEKLGLSCALCHNAKGSKSGAPRPIRLIATNKNAPIAT